MRTIICQRPGKFILKDKKEPTASTGEVIIAIRSIGICGTDIHAYNGNQAFFTYPRILGHELGAEIVQGNDQFKKGDRVVVIPYFNCETCVACRNEKPNCCTTLKVLGVHMDGGMQELLTIDPRYLLKANDLDYNTLAIVEPLSIAAHAVRRSDIKEGSWNLVMGCGPIGLALIKMIQLQGGRVIAMDTNEYRLSVAMEVFGADAVVDGSRHSLEKINSITDTDLAWTVFDATGNNRAIERGPAFMAHGGTFIIVGLYKEDLMFHHPSIHAKEATILCSRNATRGDFEKVIAILQNGKFPISGYITHQLPFDNLIDQFDLFNHKDSKAIKAVVRI